MKKAGKLGKQLRRKESDWEWLERYRVWDANRKIFLYPENWIEPELRLPTRFRASLSEVVCILFTGKNRMSALVAARTLARDLGKDLYRVDLSGVVSKYIGETEKNLRRVFDAARKGGAVLFFDEADALFGKRTNVKDGHDRYANIEIDYLLERIEDYAGLEILANGNRTKIDNAFSRRFHFVISMPLRRKPRWKESSVR